MIFGSVAPAFAHPAEPAASAQGGQGRYRLVGFSDETFPTLEIQMEVYDGEGRGVPDLQLNEVMVLENGVEIPATGLRAAPRPLQFTVAIKSSPALAAALGADRPETVFQALQTELNAWAARQDPASFGDLSLAGDTGLHLIRSEEKPAWEQAITGLNPDLQKPLPGLNALVSALDLAEEQAQPGESKPAILFITAPVEESELGELLNQQGRAARLGAAVSVWFIVPANAQTDQVFAGMNELQQLAAASGGRFAQVRAGDGFPRLEDWIEPLRPVYTVEYPTQVQSGGQQRVNVRVERAGLPAMAEKDWRFNLEVAAPNPIFIQPPLTVERSWTPSIVQKGAVLVPDSLDVQIVVEFPDGHPRPLRKAQLLVNNEVAAEAEGDPLGKLTWNLAPYTASTDVVLRVEVEDSLGIKGMSSEILLPVKVAERSSAGLLARISPQGLVAIAAVLLAGMALGLVLLSELRRQRLARQPEIHLPARRRKDPLTQPVVIPQEQPSARRNGNTTPRPTVWPKGAPHSLARLVRTDAEGQAGNGNQVALNRPEITFGNDPRQAVVVLPDASVSPLHARLIVDQSGRFRLEDCGSVAGTWVNCLPCNGSGWLLQHGDQVQLGRVGYRFELAGAGVPGEVVITPLENDPGAVSKT